MSTTLTLRPRASRPAYLDGLFSPKQAAQDYRPRTPSLSRSAYSSTESINASMSSNDTQQNFNTTRPLTPACEEEYEGNSSGDDNKSVLSLSLSRSLKPRLRLRNFSLHRRSEPQLQRNGSSSRPTSGDSTGKTSPNVANFFQKRHSNPASKTLPAVVPTQAAPVQAQTQELNCHRCYYFAARNCKGWTMGGAANDACEACLVSFEHIDPLKHLTNANTILSKLVSLVLHEPSIYHPSFGEKKQLISFVS